MSKPLKKNFFFSLNQFITDDVTSITDFDTDVDNTQTKQISPKVDSTSTAGVTSFDILRLTADFSATDVTATIDVTPTIYCRLTTNNSSRTDIFITTFNAALSAATKITLTTGNLRKKPNRVKDSYDHINQDYAKNRYLHRATNIRSLTKFTPQS